MSSILHTVKSVAWAFFGIRKNSEYQNDLAKLNPLHIVLVALVAVVVIVVGVAALVHWIAG